MISGIYFSSNQNTKTKFGRRDLHFLRVYSSFPMSHGETSAAVILQRVVVSFCHVIRQNETKSILRRQSIVVTKVGCFASVLTKN